MRMNVPLELRQGLALAAEGLPLAAQPESQAACLDFVAGRMRSYLNELPEGFRYDVVEAVLAAQQQRPAGVLQAVAELSRWTQRPDWTAILPAYARCVRITREFKERFKVVPEAFVEEAERDLFSGLRAAQELTRRPGDVEAFFSAFVPLIPAINRFFLDVLVMANDVTVRQNRLGLLQGVASLAEGIADFSKLEGF
jgi:glycyl-tRNA synthetase